MRGMAQTSRSDPVTGGAVPTLLARMELGRYPEAVEDLEQAARLAPRHPFAESDRKVAAELAGDNGSI